MKLILRITAVPVKMSNMKFIFKLISVYVESLIDMLMLKLIESLMLKCRDINDKLDIGVDDEFWSGDDDGG